MKSFTTDWLQNESYLEMLKMIASLSRLFSEAKQPFLQYRVAENLFCKYYNAENLARTDTAFDALLKDQNCGIGIKTYVLPQGKNKSSVQKIAEFDSLSSSLSCIKGKKLAVELAKYRNERIQKASFVYDIKSSLYHIIGRDINKLILFNTDYDQVNLDGIKVRKDDSSTLKFTDGIHEYSYSKSKSTLYRKFDVVDEFSLDVDVILEPYDFLELAISKFKDLQSQIQNRPYVILPLYSTGTPKNNEARNEKGKYVPSSSGLNQWHAKGRKRDENEIYIPYPACVRNNFPDFLEYHSKKDVEQMEYVKLILPNGEVYEGKRCQSNGKALMTNKNKSLGKWLLRDVLKIEPNRVVTIKDLDKAGFDSVILYKNKDNSYSIDICNSNITNPEE